MLSNVRSLENKLDLIQLSRSTQHETRDCFVFVYHRNMAKHNIPWTSSIQLHGLNCLPEQDRRDSSLSGKTRGGGLFFISTKEWCTRLASNIKTLFIAGGVYVCEVPAVSICRGSSRPLLLPRFTYHRVQMLRTRFVNCTAPSANNKQITPTAFSS